MFETDVPSRAVAQLVDGSIDQIGVSPRRWAVLLVVLLVGALALLFVTRRAVVTSPSPAPAPAPPATDPDRSTR